MKTEALLVALLLFGCDTAKVKVNVEATGDNIMVDGTRKTKVELKKDATGTTVNGQPVKDVDVRLRNGQIDVHTTPPR
jgi:hypothetical protein